MTWHLFVYGRLHTPSSINLKFNLPDLVENRKQDTYTLLYELLKTKRIVIFGYEILSINTNKQTKIINKGLDTTTDAFTVTLPYLLVWTGIVPLPPKMYLPLQQKISIKYWM